MKAIVHDTITNSLGNMYVGVSFWNSGAFVESQYLQVTTAAWSTNDQIVAAMATAIMAYSTTHSYGLTSSDLLNPLMAATPTALSLSLVTGTGAVGTLISATNSAFVYCSVTIATTATIGGAASGTVVLETAPTNSATAGDWVEIDRFTNGQAITLAIALQSVQTLGGAVSGFVPAGYYVKLRSINNSGTPTYSFNSGQKTLI